MFSARRLAGFALTASCAALLVAPSAFAFDFKTVGTTPAILYATPSAKGNKLYVAPPGMPLQILLTYGDWVKVRDMNGDTAWTQAKGLRAQRNVLVSIPGARVHAAPDEHSAVLMTADKGVMLILRDPTGVVWARVHHRDGIDGYIKVSDVWGL